jgi:protein-disulfide isomerase
LSAEHAFDPDDSWELGGLPVRGSVDALVTIVEFSDFECPFCARVSPVMDRLLEEFSEHVRVVFVQAPLAFHSNAHRAAQASLAAHSRGEFWAYHDLIFQDQHELLERDLVARAEELGLDAAAFARELQSGTYRDEVDRQLAVGARLGVRGTPNFFINGRNVRGAQPYEVFRAAVEEELSAAEGLLQQDLTRGQIYQRRRDANLAEDEEEAVAAQPARPAEPSTFAAAGLPSTPYFRGPDDALVTIVEFTDYQCPYCSRANATVDELLAANDDVRVVIRHNPLAFHQRADEAAAAAVAAAQQGMFWEYHDILFGSVSSFDNSELEGFAEELGLDMPQWQEDRVSQATLDTIAEDQTAAADLGAAGTPHFFVNGERIRGAQPLQALQVVVDSARERAEAAIENGTDRDSLYGSMMEDIGSLDSAQQEPDAPQPVTLDTSSAPTYGAVDAPIELVLFTDFQCLFCVRFAATAMEVAEANSDVRISLMHFPLAFHSDAYLAAQGAVEAAEQGLFWEFYRVLHENGTAVDRGSLEAYAFEVGLNLSEFQDALDQGEHAAAVDADMAVGTAAGVRATPSWFVNGIFYSGAHPRDFVQTAVDSVRLSLGE